MNKGKKEKTKHMCAWNLLISNIIFINFFLINIDLVMINVNEQSQTLPVDVF